MKNHVSSAGGPRNNAWNKSKLTNLRPYSPYSSHAEKIFEGRAPYFQKSDGVVYHAYPAVSGCVQPLDVSSIQGLISKIPSAFISDLFGVFVCPGSKKLLSTPRDMMFGCYWPYRKSIFLFPFPQSMGLRFRKQPKPSICLEYERHGATWKHVGKFWELEFSPEALRSFYLRDVLVHEIGHHVEHMASLDARKNTGSSERFAEWFAFEFGMKNKSDPKSEFGETLSSIIRAKDAQTS